MSHSARVSAIGSVLLMKTLRAQERSGSSPVVTRGGHGTKGQEPTGGGGWWGLRGWVRQTALRWGVWDTFRQWDRGRMTRADSGQRAWGGGNILSITAGSCWHITSCDVSRTQL